jgi:hypothetical protein
MHGQTWGPVPARRSLAWLEVFAVDVRSLAALRVVLALTVLADLALRAPNLRVHYSDEGLLPRQVLLEYLDPWLWSVALSNGTPFFQGLLFTLAAAAAVGLLLGYRTRLMTVVVWLLMLSLHWRNPAIGYSADGLLRLLLFWSLFLPLGAVWSLDRRRGLSPEPASVRVLSPATAGLLLQIACMYWFTALLKTGREWRVDGTALSSALSIEELATPLGTALLQFHALLQALTFLTLGIETVAPLLLFSPVWTVTLRLVGIAALVALQVGIWLTLAVGIFPWLAAACMVGFLPSGFWEALLPRWRRRLERVKATLTRAVPVTVPDGGWGRLAPVARPTAGDGDRRSGCAVVVRDLVAGFCLLYVLVWNLSTVSAVTLTADARALGSLLGLVQSWTMFAPFPYDSTSWYRIPGTLRDGQRVELMPFLFHGDASLRPASEEKPSDMRAAFAGDERWRKYFEHLHDAGNAHLLPPLARYLCREWNATHGGRPTQLERLEIIYHWERNLPDRQRDPVQRVVQWEHRCAEDAA